MKKRLLSVMLSAVMTVSMLSGCALSLSTESSAPVVTEEDAQMRAMGLINFEESTKGIPMNSTKDITSKLVSGCYYVRHGDVLYPCYTDTMTYTDVAQYGPEYNTRFDVFTSKSIIDIPTLFEGDSLYYYNSTGILMYTTLERFKDLGWSVGFRNIKSTPAGYVYLDTKTEDSEGPCIMSTMKEVRDMFDGNIFIDKIGDVKITKDYLDGGVISGLVEGVSYDLELYDGTNYKYYESVCNTRFFQSYEIYYLDEYKPLQDYLYEIKIPDYLLSGYYNCDAHGMFRYVKGKAYNDDTDFNERLLYQYAIHEEGDMSHDTEVAPEPYSENNLLNKYRAYDEGYFAYEQTRPKTGDEILAEKEAQKEASEGMNQLGLANFLAASCTQTDIWLPADRPVKISVQSKESTGSITMHLSSGRVVKMPYDRIAGTYTYEGTGDNSIAVLEVKGLYSDDNISLVNAESYHGQDKEIAAQEAAEADK